MADDKSASLRIGKAAVNRIRGFCDDHGLVFTKIDGEDDIGFDGTLNLARTGSDAGLTVNLQIKGGRKYKRRIHVDDWYQRRGQASFRSADWQLWDIMTAPRGFEGHHVTDMDVRLRNIWRNGRPAYVFVHDSDDGELHFGNLARMADVEPLAQELVRNFNPTKNAGRNPKLHRYLTSVDRRISRMSEEEVRTCRTMIPLYPDLRLTPDGLDRFMSQTRAEVRQHTPDPSNSLGAVAIFATYADGTIGLSREALDARRRQEENGQD